MGCPLAATLQRNSGSATRSSTLFGPIFPPCSLRQLKAARKQLRDFNTAARVQLEAQGAALEAGAAVLAGMRADLDAVNAALTARKQELLAQHPHLRDRLLARTPDVD